MRRDEAQLIYGDHMVTGLYPENLTRLRDSLSTGVGKRFIPTDGYVSRTAKYCRFIDETGLITERGYEFSLTGYAD
jgi:hypothetical protein